MAARVSEDMRLWSLRRRNLCPVCERDLDLGCTCSDTEVDRGMEGGERGERDVA